jgi:hypothetical protein
MQLGGKEAEKPIKTEGKNVEFSTGFLQAAGCEIVAGVSE